MHCALNREVIPPSPSWSSQNNCTGSIAITDRPIGNFRRVFSRAEATNEEALRLLNLVIRA
jgi:hypothetical protein